jgi:hypothetical protein
MEGWWNDTDRRKLKDSEKSVCQYHSFVRTHNNDDDNDENYYYEHGHVSQRNRAEIGFIVFFFSL